MSQATSEIDVRRIAPPERHPRIFQTFDALAPGEAFVLVNDHYPKPLLYQFQMERPGQFDWSVLEAQPDRHAVEIRRRESASPRGVSEYLEWDHRRLDGIFAEVERLVGDGAFVQAAARFSHFRCGLSHHIDMEEQVLFPAFEERTGMTSGPTAVMRQEHVEIRGLLGEIDGALAAGDASRVAAAAGGLHRVLGAHNDKEEGILYPMTDRTAGGDRERDELVRRMQAL